MTTTKKTWQRYPQINKIFPKPKYHFDQYLSDPGDFIETNPITPRETDLMYRAALFWAYNRKYTIRTKRWRKLNGDYILRITLVDKKRIRDYV